MSLTAFALLLVQTQTPLDAGVLPEALHRRQVHRCLEDERPDGFWRYALVGGLYNPVEDLSLADLRQLWQGKALKRVTLRAASDVVSALGPALGPSKKLTEGAASDSTFALVPAHELTPLTKVITVDGHHPLSKEPGVLAIPLCGADAHAAQNLDLDKLTTFAMTGTTALTRGTAKLLDSTSPTYPARDVAFWFKDTDFVHISNEVSFTPDCDPTRTMRLSFCSRESYLGLLEAVHANVIELTGSHLTDFGRQYVNHTLELYEARGWRWFGGGRDEAEGEAPLFLTHHGNRLALVGCNMMYTAIKLVTPGQGPAPCDWKRLDWQVNELRRAGWVPIVSVQHEEVYTHVPPGVLVRDFRRMAEDGAAFVLGSQAHSAHPWEVHHGAYIHYGPGNFFFDQMSPITRDGAVDRLYFYENRLLTVGHLYTRIEEGGRPRPLTAVERVNFLSELTEALAKVPVRSRPLEPPRPIVPSPESRPDSVLLSSGELVEFMVTPPEGPTRGLPLIVECGATTVPTWLEAPALRVTVGGVCGADFKTRLRDFLIRKYEVDPLSVL